MSPFQETLAHLAFVERSAQSALFTGLNQKILNKNRTLATRLAREVTRFAIPTLRWSQSMS